MSHPRPSERVLGLELETTRGIKYFTFPPGADRVFVVGSSQQADLRLENPAVSAVEVLLERRGPTLLALPALAERPLLVNARPAHAAVPLEGTTILEVGGERIVATAFDATGIEGIPTSELRRETSGYLRALPDELDATAVALPAVPFGPGFTERLVRPAFGLGPTGTEVIRRPLVPALVPSPQPALVVEARAAVRPASIASALTTEFDGRAFAPPRVAGARDVPTQLSMPAPGFRARLAFYSRRLPRGIAARALEPLSRLGTTARKRPVFVGAVGTLLAAAVALLLAGAKPVLSAKGPAPRVRPPATLSSAPPAPRASSSTAPAPTLAVVSAPSASAMPAVRASARREPFDVEVANAAKQLASGLDEQARAAYANLARRTPPNPAYAVLARLLGEIATKDCNGPTPQAGAACPQVSR